MDKIILKLQHYQDTVKVYLGKLDELKLAKSHRLDSTFYWRRKKEIEQEIIKIKKELIKLLNELD